MRSAATTRWTVGAVVVALAVMALGWLLLISPLRDAEAEAREQIESEQARIDQLEIQLAGLRADYERLPELKAELEDLRVQLPTGVLIEDLTRQLDAIADDNDVFVLGITPSTPYAVVAPTAPAPAQAETADSGTSEEGEATPAPAEPEQVQLPSGFYAVPVQVALLGSYADTISFVEELQLENPRLVLVNSFTATVQDENGAGGGRPATEKGDLETTLGLIAWVLVQDGQVSVVDEGEEVPAVELPSGNGNPFAPLQ